MSQAQVDVEADAEVRAQLGQILDDIRELPERQRGALVMRELAGLEYPEIAAALETSPAGAKQAIYEARQALFDLAKGRDMDCEQIQRTLSDGDGRAVRGRALRAHLRACSSCRDFGATITARRSKLAALSPAMPAGMAARILQSVLGGGAGGSQAGLIAGVAAPAAVKSISAVALMIAAGAGATQVATSAADSRPSAREASSTVIVHDRSARPVSQAIMAGRRGPSVALGGQSGAGQGTDVRRGHTGAPDDTHLPPAKPGKSHGRHADSTDTIGSPAAHTPGTRRTPMRPGRGQRRPGRGGTPVRDQVQTQLNQVQTQVDQVRDVAGTTVDTVRDALPVKTPKLPLAPKRKG
jgi:hypothetical protein